MASSLVFKKRVCTLLSAGLALSLWMAVPRHARAQAHSSSKPIPNASVRVEGTRNGKFAGDWSGELIWHGPIPSSFTVKRTQQGWVWTPYRPKDLRIKLRGWKHPGKTVERWARDVRADKVEISIKPRSGNAKTNTARAYRPKKSRRAPRSPTRHESSAPRDAPVGDHPGGQSDRGVGTGRGQGGDQKHDGPGDNRGRHRGYAGGSVHPSHIQNKRAQLTSERGGHTPADGGKRFGSAGGTQRATGHIHGSGWIGLVDAPEYVAPLVSAGLILTDANILGFGRKMLSRAVHRMSARVLRKELTDDAARVVAHDLVKVRDKLARDPNYRSLPRAEQQATIKRAEEAMQRQYFAKAKRLFSDEAVDCDKLAAKYASQAGEVQKYNRTVATKNATAYRKMAKAADDMGGGYFPKGAGAGAQLNGRHPPISPRQRLHTDGTPGKSQFKPGVDANSVTRTAWEQGVPVFDRNGKFLGKRFTFQGKPIGTSPSGHDQWSIFVHWSPTRGIHGVPTTTGVQ